MAKNKVIFLIVLLVFASLWGGWVFIYIKEAKKPQNKAQPTSPADNLLELKSLLKSGPTKTIFQEKVQDVSFPFLFEPKEIIYFSEPENKFFSYNLDTKLLTNLEAINLEDKKVLDVKYYPLLEKILIFLKKDELTEDEENLSFRLNNFLTEKIVYDTKTQEVFSIKNPRYLQLALLPENKFVYYYFNESAPFGEIDVEDLKRGGIERKKIYEFKEQKDLFNLNFYGVYENKLYYSLKENGGNSLFVLDLVDDRAMPLYQEKNKKILSGFSTISISPSGKKIFYRLTDEKSFFVDNLSNGEVKKIDFEGGIWDKILWTSDENYFYYLEGEKKEANERGEEYNLSRKLMKFDIQNNRREMIFDFSAEGNFGLKDVFLSSDEKTLYFVNVADNNLYYLSLTNQ